MEVAPPRVGSAFAARFCRRQRGCFALIVAVCCVAAPTTAAAQPALAPPPAPAPGPTLGAEADLQAKLAKPGDLSLRGAPLSEALFTISQTWNVNIVAGEELPGQINSVFKQAPLREILDTILLSNGCSYRIVGQSIVVLKLKDIGDVNPLFETAIVRVNNVKPDELLAAIKMLSSPQGKCQAIPSARSMLIADFPDRVAMIRNYVQKIDAESQMAGAGSIAADDGRLQVAYFALQHVTPTALKDPITSLLSKEGKVTVMEADSRLIVFDYGPQLDMIRRTIEQLDVPRTQVRITALIYDLSIEDLERLGINWNSVAKARDSGTQLTIDTITAVAAPAAAPQGTITLMNLSKNFDLTGVIDLLQNCKTSRLLADPHVTVVDNSPAKIEIVTEIPYQQLTQTSGGGNIGTTSFREAGVKLEVIPRIASDGTIRMECNPVFSRLTGYTPGDQPQPIIDRREARTNVRVANGQTLVIGGLRQRTNIDEHTGIPYLQDIKFLHIGKLFQHKSTTSNESELVVFITPEIITPTDPGNAREQAARETGNCRLDEIPLGDRCAGSCRVVPLPAVSPDQPSGEEIRLPAPVASPTESSRRVPTIRRLPRTDDSDITAQRPAGNSVR